MPKGETKFYVECSVARDADGVNYRQGPYSKKAAEKISIDMGTLQKCKGNHYLVEAPKIEQVIQDDQKEDQAGSI